MVTGPLGLSIERDARLEWGSGSNGVMGGTGTTTIAPGASLALLGGRLRDTRTVRNQGTATFTGDLLDEGGRFINEGTILLAGDVGFPVHGGTGTLTNTTSGTIRKTAGTGTSNMGIVANDGTIQVQSGTLTAQNYTSGSSSRLEVNLSGTTPGSGYSALAVQTTATLDGALALMLGGPFRPPPGSAYEVVRFASRNGTFATIESPISGPNFTASYGSNSVTVTAGPYAVKDR